MIEDDVARVLRSAGITDILYLPCERVKLLISILTRTFRPVPLAREEEGVGIAAGLFMGGRRPAILVQSSGFGNMVNALMSLTRTYALPLPLLISWRGVFGEKIPAQVPMGGKLPKLLDALDIEYATFSGENLSDLENLISSAYEEARITAVLLRPDIWSPADDVEFEPREFGDVRVNVSGGKARYTRFEIIEGIKEHLEGKIVVSNIGYPSRELYSILDQPTNFYMLGSMGLATSIALGLNLTGREVVSLDGDGSILMNPSTIFTAGLLSEKGLKIIAIDNSAYGSTGNQKTATVKADLAMLGLAAGLKVTRASTPEEIISAMRQDESVFIHALAKPGNAKVGVIPMRPVEIKERFMEAIR
ncbi:sulfopyruvate decarboxylase subunit alpha [Geoglobus ahangari]